MLEIEKKWLLREIPDLTQYGFKELKKETIFQTYLSESERLRRIASTEHPGKTVYKHFKKTYVAKGACTEEPKDITEEEYTELFNNSGIADLVKGRTTWLDPEGVYEYEVDYIHYRYPDISIGLLEIEFQKNFKTMEEIDAAFKLPDFMDKYVLMDVTGNPKFTNFNLARKR